MRKNKVLKKYYKKLYGLQNDKSVAITDDANLLNLQIS